MDGDIYLFKKKGEEMEEEVRESISQQRKEKKSEKRRCRWTRGFVAWAPAGTVPTSTDSLCLPCY